MITRRRYTVVFTVTIICSARPLVNSITRITTNFKVRSFCEILNPSFSAYKNILIEKKIIVNK